MYCVKVISPIFIHVFIQANDSGVYIQSSFTGQLSSSPVVSQTVSLFKSQIEQLRVFLCYANCFVWDGLQYLLEELSHAQ